MNIADEMEGKRYVVKKVQRKAKHKGGELVWHNIKTAPDYSWKAKFNDIILDNYVNGNIIKGKVRQNEGEEEETEDEGRLYNVEVENEFDEHLLEEIQAGRIPAEFLNLFEDHRIDD